MAKILLVEDDNNLREIYEARLQAEGYDIVAAQDGEAALVVAKQEQPDLVISDVMMPRISGFEMLDILRNTQGMRDVKVIMLTALGQAEDKTRADKLGADRYLVKSQVTLEDIVHAAAELLGGNAAAGDTPPAPAAEPETATAPAPEPASEPTPVVATAAATPVPTPEPIATPASETAAPVVSEPAVTPASVTPAPEPSDAPAPASDPLATPQPAPAPEPAVASSPDPASVGNPFPPVSTVPAPDPAPDPIAAPAMPEPQPAPAEPSAPTPAPTPDSSVTPPAPVPEPPTATPPTPVETGEQAITDTLKSLIGDANTQQPTSEAVIPASAESVEEPVKPEAIDSETPPTSDPDPAAVVDAPTESNESTATPETPSEPIPAAPETTPTPAVPQPTSDDSDTTTRKKIIQPLDPTGQPVQPDLNELLAKEGITDFDKVEQQAPAASYAAQAQPPAGMPHPHEQAPQLHAPGHVIIPGSAQPTGSDGKPIDPNSIAL
jgi:CheY-like chemotaxis protein